MVLVTNFQAAAATCLDALKKIEAGTKEFAGNSLQSGRGTFGRCQHHDIKNVGPLAHEKPDMVRMGTIHKIQRQAEALREGRSDNQSGRADVLGTWGGISCAQTGGGSVLKLELWRDSTP